MLPESHSPRNECASVSVLPGWAATATGFSLQNRFHGVFALFPLRSLLVGGVRGLASAWRVCPGASCAWRRGLDAQDRVGSGSEYGFGNIPRSLDSRWNLARRLSHLRPRPVRGPKSKGCSSGLWATDPWNSELSFTPFAFLPAALDWFKEGGFQSGKLSLPKETTSESKKGAGHDHPKCH
jgi:hypothetical protein